MAQHGIFYMEDAGGYKPADPENSSLNDSGGASAKLFCWGGGKGRRLEGQRRNGAGH